jgi:hypothetical protein
MKRGSSFHWMGSGLQYRNARTAEEKVSAFAGNRTLASQSIDSQFID